VVQTHRQLLPTAEIGTAQLNYIIMREPITAIMLGITLGMLLSIAASKELSAHYIKTCPTKPTHHLVKITNFTGDTYYCVDKKHLN
jgi:Mg/Co/Ni transporter MgtE